MGKLLEDKVIRVALYSRVSTEEQTDNFSLGAQGDLLKKHAKDNRYDIYEEYVDGGYSGASYERPAFQKLLKDARERRFDLVLVYRLDRFFRSNKDLLNVVDELASFDVNIKSITEPFDTTNYLGKFILSLFGSIAELERSTFIERSKAGRLRRYREGYYSGSTPCKYGYDYNKEKKVLEINEKEAEVVRLVFKLYNEPDSSLLKVARNIRKLGCRTKTGKSFVAETVHDIIKSQMYTGVWHANKHGKKKLKPRDEWIEVKVPKIIEKEEFEHSQRLLKQRRNYSRRNVKYDYLLQGFLSCGDCGCTVAGTADTKQYVKKGKKYGPYNKLYYRCTHFYKNTLKKTVKCGLKYVQAELLEKAVWDKISEVLNKPKLVEEALNSKAEIVGGDKKSFEKELLGINKHMLSLVGEENRIIEAYRHNVISMEQLNVQLKDIKQAKENFSRTSAEIQMKLNGVTSKEDVQKASDYLYKVKSGIKKFNFDTKRKLLKLLNARIKVNINGIADIFLTIPKFSPNIFPSFELVSNMLLL